MCGSCGVPVGAEASSEESSQDRQCSMSHEAREARPRHVEPEAMYSEDCIEDNQERTPGSARTPKLPQSFVSSRLRREADRQREPQHRDAQRRTDAKTRRSTGASRPSRAARI